MSGPGDADEADEVGGAGDAGDAGADGEDPAWEAAAADIARADAMIEGGDPEGGLRLATDAAERLAAIVGEEHPDRAQAIVTQGDALAALGRMGDSEARYREARAILEPYMAGEDAEVVRPYRVNVLSRLGHLGSLAGRYDEAEATLREALAEAALVYGEGAPELAGHLNTLGVCLRFAGRYDEALAAYEAAAKVRDAAGETQPATHFHNLSGLATARGDHAAAVGHAREACARREAEEGRGFALGTDLCGLGDALAGLGQYAEAEAAYREALGLYAASAQHEHPEVAYALHNLADTLCELGRHDEAEATYREAIARKTVMLGAGHYEVAVTMNNLASLLSTLGRDAEALAASREAVAIVGATLPAGHPLRVGCEELGRRLTTASPPAGT